MKSRFCIPLILICLVLISSKVVHALTPPRPESIVSFQSDITINSDGTINVTETIVYTFPTARHGISRQIPLVKINQDGDKFRMSARVERVLQDGVEAQMQDNSTNDELNIRIGDPDRTIIGTHSYEISYKVSGALTYFTDHDELYWDITGNDWAVPIVNSGAFIRLPYDERLDSAVDGRCFTGYLGSTEYDCGLDPYTASHPREIDTIGWESNRELLPGEGLTVVTRFPKDIVAVLEPKRDYSGTLIAIGYFLYAVVLPGYLIVRALKIRKKLPEERVVVSAWFDPPKLPAGRFLTAGETGTLIDRRVDIRDISGELIQLAQKGFIKIREEEKKSGFIIKKPIFTFVKQKEWESATSLQDHEKKLLDIIFIKSDEVSTEQIGKRIGFTTKLNDVMNDIANQLVTDGLFSKNVITNRNIWTAVLVLSIFVFNPLLALAALVNMYAVKRTSAGGDAIAKAQSLKNFMVTQDEQYKFQAENKVMFEKLLPYAVSFGIEKIWIDRFKDLIKSPPDWYEGSSGQAFNYALLSNSFNDSVRSASQMSSTRSSSGFSSGFSGGGFSGGGGGGGGGGSW